MSFKKNLIDTGFLFIEKQHQIQQEERRLLFKKHGEEIKTTSSEIIVLKRHIKEIQELFERHIKDINEVFHLFLVGLQSTNSALLANL